MIAVWTGPPPKAPSRSTTCRRGAPSAAQRSAMATGSSENTVSAEALPWSRRTQRPPLRSTAGMTLKFIQPSPHGFALQLELPRLRLVGASRLEHHARPSRTKAAKAPALALLRMELRREEGALADGGREGDAVGAGRCLERRVGRRGVVRMHEVEV